eukprot:1086703-Pyramimonas_sp.AAC.1
MATLVRMMTFRICLAMTRTNCVSSVLVGSSPSTLSSDSWRCSGRSTRCLRRRRVLMLVLML